MTFMHASKAMTLLLALATAMAHAQPIQKPEFTFNLPADWEEIPQEVLEAAHSEARRQLPDAQVPRYDYGFQPVDNDHWMDYPYLLIQVNHLGRIPDRQLAEMPPIDMNALMREKSPDFAPLMSNLRFGQLQYDKDLGVVWMTSQSDIVGIGPILGLSGIIPTERGVVQLNGYARESDFANYIDSFRQMVLSVHIAPELAYRPRQGDSDGWLDWGEVGSSAMGGALIGAAIGVLLTLLRRRKKEKPQP